MMRSLPAFALSITSALAERLDRANQHMGVEFLHLSRVKGDPRVLTLLPPSIVNEHKVVPISFANNRLTLAMTNPNNIMAFDDVRRIIKGVLIDPAIVTDDDFRRFISTVYAPATARPDAPAPRPQAKSVAMPAPAFPSGTGTSTGFAFGTHVGKFSAPESWK